MQREFLFCVSSSILSGYKIEIIFGSYFLEQIIYRRMDI
jgi:hypothetical protein